VETLKTKKMKHRIVTLFEVDLLVGFDTDIHYVRIGDFDVTHILVDQVRLEIKKQLNLC
jgi:hypothetical protein